MKFNVSSSSLAAKLVALGKVINSKNSLPILGDIVFDIQGTQLNLMASDSEVWMQTGLELTEADGDCSFAIGSHDIIEAVKGLSEQPLTFDVDLQKNLVKIIYNNGNFSMPVEDHKDFPKPVEIKGDVHKQIDKAIFNECISRALFGCGDSDLRPVMNGEYFDFTDKYLAIVASDGLKLVRNMLTEYKSETIGSFIMPKKVVAVLRSTFNKEAGEVHLHFDDRNAKLEFDTTTITFRLIEGRYPNYNSVIPQNNPNEARVDRACLLAALKRVQNFSNSSSYLVCFRFEGDKLQLDAEDYGFKSSTFVDILANMTSKEVIIQLSDPSRAALVVPAEQKEGMEVLMLIMPMLLNN